ncbi:MAG: ParM/StbA family protein [Pseudomonadales bacterium]|nr:ParM/StbA family protein [Pseudomonadales bacterium]
MEICVIDDGAAQTKLRFRQNGRLKTIKFPSLAVDYFQSDTHGIVDSAYYVESECYTVVAREDDPIRTDTNQFQTSRVNRVFIHEALRRAGITGEVIVGVTLPLHQYFELGITGVVNTARIDQKKRNVMGPIQGAKRKLVTISNCVVFPESLPAGIDELMMMEKGELKLKPEYVGIDRICCIDVGGHSVDIILFDALSNRVINKKTIESGVLKLVDRMQNRLGKMLELSVPVERSVATKAIETKVYDGHDLTDIIDEVSLPLVQKIMSTVAEVASPRSTDLFLIVGGGAQLVEKPMRSYTDASKVVIPENPDEAIVRGAFKMLETRVQQETIHQHKAVKI